MTEQKDIFAPKSGEQVLRLVLGNPLAWIVSLDAGAFRATPLPLRPRVGVIVVSALQRTRQTADIVGRSLHGVETVVDAAFNERRLGEWNRRPIAETQAELAAGITPPGGESNAEFTQRIRDAVVATLLPLLGQRPLLIASKGVARVLGELAGHGASQPLDNAGLAVFDLSPLLRQCALECAA